MPTYDYECEACDHGFELFQQISDPLKRKCPECGKLKLRRLFGTGAAVVFKGSGFYETDYRSDAYNKAAEKERKQKSAKPDSSVKSDGSKHAKSETAKEPAKAATSKPGVAPGD